MGKLNKKKANEIQIAHSRLKGALKDIVKTASDEEVSDNECDSENKANTSIASLRNRGRPKKMTKSNIPTDRSTEKRAPPTSSSNSQQGEGSEENLHESFIMKLFDRSVDLAKYNENTPLYPICRAWLANQPKSNAIKNLRDKRSSSPQSPRVRDEFLLQKVLNDEIEVTSLPPPKSTSISRIPSPIPEQKIISKDIINVGCNTDSDSPTKEDLLQEHKERWSKISQKWNTHSKILEERYSKSYEIIDALYKP